MKKCLMLLAAFMIGVQFSAQNKLNLVIFSEDAEPFHAYVNGVKQNEKAESNVKITGLSPNISLRIVFENKALPDLKQNMSLDPGFEHTARIKRDKNQQLKLRYFGQTPLEESTSSGAATVAYHSVETSGAAPENSGNISSTSVSSTTTTTRTSATPGNEHVSVNISIAGVGMNTNVTATEQSGATMNTTTSTTVTSSGSGYSETRHTESAGQPAAAPSSAGCSAAMTQSSFSNMKKSVESKPFSDTKMSTAKVATKNNCLSVSQVKEICKLFAMDEDKLTYAKYAYDYCVDKGNFYQVSEVFAFSSTTEEFNSFLEK